MKILQANAFLLGESSSPHTTLNSTNQGDDAVLLGRLGSIGSSDPPLSWAAGELMNRKLFFLLGLSGSLLLNACGSGAAHTPPPPVTVATRLSVSSPGAAAVGAPFIVTVFALDATGNQVPTYSGTVHLTSSDTKAVLPPDSMLGTGSAGFSVTLKTVGNQTITATDMAAPSITGTSRTINTAASVEIISGLPPNGATGQPYGPFHKMCCGKGSGNFFQLAANASGTWSWAAAPGSLLPPGVNCCSLTIKAPGPFFPPGSPGSTTYYGVISGVPQVAGTYNVVVSFLESETTNIATATYAIVISAAQAAANATADLASATEPSSEKAHAKHHMYKLIDLGTFGGPNSFINCCAGSEPNLSKRGAVVGGADTSIPNPHGANPNPLLCCEIFVNPAFKWQDGDLIELAALPGGFNGFAVSINDSGAVIGTAENGETDPLQGYPESHPALWKDGRTIDLGTFGGYEGLAFAINNHGQVAGFAQNAISDPFGYFGFGTQSRAFLWQDGTLQDLGTLGGNDAGSLYLNDEGQVAGASFTNATPNPVIDACGGFGTPVPTEHPFIWENGQMTDLGTLGGTCGFPNQMNGRGQVVGQSDLSGDLTFHPFFWDRGVLKDLGTFGGPSGSANAINDAGQVVGYGDLPGGPCQGYFCVHHAFLWDHGLMTDLGTLPTEICSNAVSINQRGQIMGYSTPGCNGNIFHPVLWENGTIYDLGALIVPGSDIALGEFSTLNDRGEMAGLGTLPNGDLHSVLLIPCDAEHENVEGCDYKLVDAPAASSNATAFTQSTPSTARGVANPMAQNEAMRARSAHWHHLPSFGPNM